MNSKRPSINLYKTLFFWLLSELGSITTWPYCFSKFSYIICPNICVKGIEFPILSKKCFQQNMTTLNICWNTIWFLIFIIYKKWQKYMTKLENLTHYPPQSPLPSETWFLDHLSSDKSLPFTFDVSIYSTFLLTLYTFIYI